MVVFIFYYSAGRPFESLIRESWACTNRDAALKPSGKHLALGSEVTLIWPQVFHYFFVVVVLLS